MNGQERAEENFQAFERWVRGKSDSDFCEMAGQGRLNRGEICRECNFSRSVLTQNPRVKEALRRLEERLRDSGVLPRVAELGAALPLRAKGQMQATAELVRARDDAEAGRRATPLHRTPPGCFLG